MEKRKSSRVEFDINAMVKYDNNVVEGMVRDLSLRGLFVETDKSIPIGTRVTIVVSLQGSTSDLTVNVTGSVVRHESDGFAIHFEEMDLDSFVHIRNIVAYNEGDADRVREEFAEIVKEHVEEEEGG